jgi:YVTN family beta-propeller protein
MIPVLSAAFKRGLLPKELLAIGVIALLFSVTTAERVDEHFSPYSTATERERENQEGQVSLRVSLRPKGSCSVSETVSLSNETLFAQWAYVPSGTNKVSVIDVLTSTVIKVISVADNPGVITISPDGTRVYVTHSAIQGITVIDTKTNTAIDFISVNAPQGIAITPDGTHAYVVNSPGNSPVGNVSVIDIATRTVVGTRQVASFLCRVAISPDGTHAYVTSTANTVVAFDTKTLTTVAIVRVGVNGDGNIAITPDGAWVYVQNSGGVVSVFDTQTYTARRTIVGSNPRGIAVTLDGRVGVTSGNSTVSIIDSRVLAVIDTIQSDDLKSPYGIAFTLDGTQAYVVNTNGGSVSIIDLKTSAVIKTIEGVDARRDIAIGQIPQ